MKRKLALTLALLAFGASGTTAQAKSNAVAFKCPGIVKGVNFYKHTTWKWQDKLGVARTKSYFNPHRVTSCGYSKWVAQKWIGRSLIAKWKYEQYLNYLETISRDPVKAICSVFGSHCSEAITVASCESGLSPNAANGQYLGAFQMGSSERATYGHGSTVLDQAKAAYKYFVASGKDWSPWECKP